MKGMEGMEGKSRVQSMRPDHGPRQIRELSEIEIGQVLIRHYGAGCEERLVVQTLPYLDLGKSKHWRMKAKTLVSNLPPSQTEKSYEHIFYLSDCGVVPYENGQWPIDIWLEKPEITVTT